MAKGVQSGVGETRLAVFVGVGTRVDQHANKTIMLAFIAALTTSLLRLAAAVKRGMRPDSVITAFIILPNR